MQSYFVKNKLINKGKEMYLLYYYESLIHWGGGVSIIGTINNVVWYI